MAGVVIILCVAFALASRRMRTRLRMEQEDYHTIHPFNLHPFTLIRRGLLHASDRILKGRLVPESAVVLSKFRNAENVTNSVNTQAMIPPPRSSSPVRNPPVEPPQPLPTISHLREQDSGLRMVAEATEEENMVIVLPPEYTAA